MPDIETDLHFTSNDIRTLGLTSILPSVAPILDRVYMRTGQNDSTGGIRSLKPAKQVAYTIKICNKVFFFHLSFHCLLSAHPFLEYNNRVIPLLSVAPERC